MNCITKKIIIFFLTIGLIAAGLAFSGISASTSIWAQAAKNIQTEIEDLSVNLKDKRTEVDDLKKQEEILRQNIVKKRREIISLKNQLEILNAEIAKTEISIKKRGKEIEVVNLEILQIKNLIKEKEERIEIQKQRISEILRQIYKNDQKGYLEIILANDSLADFFEEVKSLSALNENLQQNIIDLKKDKEELISQKNRLDEKKIVLEKIKVNLTATKDKLDGQTLVKEELISHTKKSESRFNSMLAELKAEQEAINSDIIALEKKLRQKLEEKEKTESLKYLVGEKLMWPVPKNTITAYFHDPDYPYRYIYEHPAIDIKARQGTEVRAAASGYVARVRRDINCSGLYAYAMIIHANGLATVYGHLSQIDIEEDKFVVQGQRLGLSGGIPGTCGAGRLTTGPHHHFEVRLNGIPVDPLGYLP